MPERIGDRRAIKMKAAETVKEYMLLFVMFLYLLNRKIQRGPEPVEDPGGATSAAT